MSKWEKVRLGDVCIVNPPKKQMQALYENKVVSFIPMADVTEDGGINTNKKKSYSEVNGGFTYFIEDDVLFAKITPCMENGKGAIARGLINGLGVGSTEFHVLRPNKELVTSDWIFRFSSFSKFRELAEKNMTGSAGQKRVPKAFLENVLVPLPPLETQKQIAKTLDTAAELLSMRKLQLAELDNLIKSTFYDVFGDPITNEKGWMKKDLNEVCNKITDGEHVTPQRTEQGIYLLSARNILNHEVQLDDVDFIDENEYDRISRRIVPEENDILISCSGSVGRVCRVRGNFKFQMVRSVAILKLKSTINPIFLEYMVDTDYIQKQILRSINQSSQANLFQGKIKKLEIILPSMSIQNQFAEIVTKIEEQKTLVKIAIDETQHLFDSLMAEYFE